MGKIEDIFRGEHRKFAWFVVLLTTVFLILWLVGPGNTLIHWAGAAIEQTRQERQIHTYRKEIKEMDRRIRMIKTDKDTLEKFAREQFGFSAPGEDIYIIEE